MRSVKFGLAVGAFVVTLIAGWHRPSPRRTARSRQSRRRERRTRRPQPGTQLGETTPDVTRTSLPQQTSMTCMSAATSDGRITAWAATTPAPVLCHGRAWGRYLLASTGLAMSWNPTRARRFGADDMI
jgi:hypothetical protein